MRTFRLSTLFLLALLPCFVYASNSINLNMEVIQSAERCAVKRPATRAKMLRCPTYRQTTNYTCGPAVVMTLMRYYGKLSAKDMNRQTELQIANEMGATPGANGGTTLSQVSGWLSDHGFSVDSGRAIDSETIINNVKKGIPTLITYDRHWILAKGYNPANSDTQSKEEIIFSDSCCGTQTLPVDAIDSMWGDSHLNPRGCAGNGEYIIATPH